MVDHTKWDTAQVLAAGVLDRPVPDNKAPTTIDYVDVEDESTAQAIREGMQSGGVSASQYYGCWKVWKDGDTFSGQLMQYRVVTDEFSRLDIDAALEKARYWQSVCYG